MSLAVIAGSGLGPLARIVDPEHEVAFEDIPGVGAAKIEGHTGKILTGTIAGRPCQLVLGRRHYYEGDERPIHRLIDHLIDGGATTLLVTSAAGSLRRTLCAGDLVVIRDIIDHQNRGGRARAARRVQVDPRATALFEAAAAEARVPWQRGTMFCTSGPLYETAADVELLQYAGADVATMSGAPEVTWANRRNLPVVAVAVVTNPCTGIDASIPAHDEVLRASARAALGLSGVIMQFIVKL